MELTFLLAKVFGLYALITGVAIIMNRRHIMLAVAALVEERFAQLLTGIVSLLFGLFLINIHNDWSTFFTGLVSLFGWLAFLKGLFYLFAPEATLGRLIKKLNARKWYMIDGGIAVIAGLYLAGTAYGWF